jgi:site-specific recombinase XerD
MKNQWEFVNEYLNYGQKQRKLDEKTIRAYCIDLRQFSEFCMQKELVTSKEMIRQYILHLHEIYKQKTVKRKIASLKAFYSYLEEEEILEDNPMRRLRTEFREDKILPRSIPYSVLETLLSYMYSQKGTENTVWKKKLLNRDIAVVEILFSTGIRISELCNLTQRNIDLVQGIFCIKGKGGKERYLQIGTLQVLMQLKEYTQEWETELKTTELFFLNRYGKRYSEQSARRMIQRYTEAAMLDLHITPHMFRHAFATLLLEEEVDIRFIQKMLGHASITTTQIYAEVASKKQMEILKMKHPRNHMKILDKDVETERGKMV